MLNKNNLKNKKSQVGQTITWTVATLVILLILFLFIFAASSKNFKKLIGAGSEVKAYESLLPEQQSLFAMLEKDNGELRKIIESDSSENDVFRNEEIKQKVKEILDEFETKGIKCNFGILKGLTAITDLRASAKHKAGFFADATIMKLNEIELSLEC